ncbi:response regulator [Geoalkalibacter halelectricus]|uniref:histidine kinase n=1 Tax=Geoalkalibacter halelectricus TaxID=2847045 RepID=A0ABY5ZP97_9BACT|nr:response regulator [Geoalkalibacter halelectricus]UWZ80339.1 response regulator [Geoalkalibacter halelectricus]
MDKKYFDIFTREVQEHLAHLRQGFLNFEEQGARPEQVHALLRCAHTLKGAARMLGFGDISRLAHSLEDSLKEVEEGARVCDGPLVDMLLLATDALEALATQAVGGAAAPFDLEAVIAGLRAGAAPAEARLAAAPPGGEDSGARAEDSIRVEVARLDRLVNLVGESALAVDHLRQGDLRLQELEGDLETFLGGLRREENYRRLSAILARMREVRRQLDKDLIAFHLSTDLLTQEAQGLRMVPLALLVDDLRRVVRDLAREQGKDIRFRVSGEDVALDRLLWESLRPALIHMLRNAVDHGIEGPRERRAAGKKAAGEVVLSAHYERGGVCISLADDGCGIDPAEVRRKAVAGGRIDAEEAASLSDQDALYLILRPGLSTRAELSDVSGRGIGMDVVRAAMEQAKGNLAIHSRIGLGTEIRLDLPLTLARLAGLVVRCEGERYVLPLQYVNGVVHIREEDVLVQGGRELVRIEGRTRPLVALRDLLGLAPRMLIDSRRIPAVVVRHHEQQAVWAVGEVLGMQEVTVKSLGPQLRALSGYAGAALLADGLPALILSVPELFTPRRLGAPAVRADLAAARARKKRGRVLVVDDSITTRTMEKNILETQGYQVEVAVSGEDALDILAARSFDLIVTDIEMPGIDGFELTRQVRTRDHQGDIPVIIVTSRATDEDKRRGIEVGAQAYIVKGSFDQGKLVDAVETLIG